MVTLLAFSFSSCNGKLALFINAKSGDSYKYHVEVNQTTNVEYGEETSKNAQNMVTDFIITVDDVDSEGNLAMSYKYDAIRIDSESGGSKQTIDSKNADSEDPFSELYNSFIGKGFSVKMNKFGEVKEVNGVDELFDSMLASLGIDEDEDSQEFIEAMKEGLKDSYGEQALKSTIEQSTKVFPQMGNIKVGDSWTVDNSFNSITNIDIKITYTLEKVEGNIAHISVKSDIESDGSKTNNYMGMEMSADLSGKMTGIIKVNINNGFLSEGEIEQEISGKMNLMMPEIDGSEGESIELPMSFTTKATYSTTKM